MNYIVFDLEWNQSPGGKRWSNSRLPFEIIEIGAVKLNEKKEIVDSFQRLIKPQVYNWIHDSIHEVIHMNYKDLQNGTVFPQAVTEFIEWCGEEYYLPSAMRKTANEELWNLQHALPAAVQQRGGQQIGFAQIVQFQLHGRVSPCSEKINA